ncbi:iron-sulfur cluster assembly scaffold protein SufA [Escherichia coli]|nr:iron-sulfur cluster assembly scaffold protein SufA [Escherichia coli]EFI9566401.1 iron-sulfur cluster assembly scaffold protein SufA [Escherichia coli]EFJ2910555.1 iron-sulfur cluster assembly scaffold protein SufA [Escherichia coli]EGB0935379.1 iron-sulfur cluster assembly scaffold protein SufA [Escherichia coli]EGF1581011.1 iron-sulfur cluster assembly scaffold protein SufA [Escherichia coli]VEW06183.1 Iron-sulfur cluster assembly scaffold protein SufA [Escherichia coli]
MKQKSKSAAIAAIATALTASLAPVPAKSTILPTTVIESVTHARVVSMLTFEHHDGQVFLPLEEAIEYINGLNDNMRAALNAVIEERQNRGKGALFTDKIAKIFEESLKQCTRVKEAVKIVMAPDNLAKMYPDSLEQRIAYRNKLIRFGRAIAQGEFIARDAINAIKRSTAPDKTTSLGNTLSDGNVKAMIIAEHKNMGLPAPEFS